jgi:hypothetical protein
MDKEKEKLKENQTNRKREISKLSKGKKEYSKPSVTDISDLSAITGEIMLGKTWRQQPSW